MASKLDSLVSVQICCEISIFKGDFLRWHSIQSNLGYPNSFVLRFLYCVRISEFVQITEVVAKISIAPGSKTRNNKILQMLVAVLIK